MNISIITVAIAIAQSTAIDTFTHNVVEKHSVVIINDLKSENSSKRLTAIYRSEKLPFLTHELTKLLTATLLDMDPKIRLAAASAVRVRSHAQDVVINSIIQSIKTEEDKTIRHELLVSLAVLAPKSERAISFLCSILSDPERFNDGIYARDITSLRFESYWSEGVIAAHALAFIGRHSVSSVATLFLDEKAPQVTRQSCAAVLLHLAKHTHGYTRDIVKMIDNSDPVLRYRSIQIIDKSGVKIAADVRKSISAALEDTDEEVRVAAAFALADHDTENVTGMPVLLRLSQHSNGDIRLLALNAIINLGPKSVSGLPQLVAKLKSNDSLTRMLAVRAIGSMGHLASTAIEDVKKLKTDPSQHVRIESIATLKRLE